jgi:hypothetical protein
MDGGGTQWHEYYYFENNNLWDVDFVCVCISKYSGCQKDTAILGYVVKYMSSRYRGGLLKRPLACL